MSLIIRLKNLFTGFLSLFVSDLEKQNPEIAYQNAIDSMIDKYSRAKNATAGIVALRSKLETRLGNAQRELAQVNVDLDASLNTEDDDLSAVLVQKQEQLTQTIAGITTELEDARKNAEEAKSSLLQVQSDINRLKAEKDAMLAKLHTSKARVQLQEQLDGLSVDAEVRALDNVRDEINNTVAKASLNAELAGNDLDNRLTKLRQTSGASTAKAKVAALKAARQDAAGKSM